MTDILSQSKLCCSKECCLLPPAMIELLLSSGLEEGKNKEKSLPQARVLFLSLDFYHSMRNFPGSLVVVARQVWKHFTGQPKRPSWDLRTTLLMALLQTLCDQSLMLSFDFWRFNLEQLRWIAPKDCPIEPIRFRVYPRKLPSVLDPLDKLEDGTRVMTGEWVSSKSIKKEVIFYVHGGGYIAMSAQSHRYLTIKISKATGYRVFAFNYRLAPETRFPGALYDSVQCYLYLIHNCGIDPSNVIMMGDSAGGGLCMALLLYLRDHHLPLPRGAILLSPWVDLTYSGPSWKDAAHFDCIPPEPKLWDKNPARLYVDHEALWRHPYVLPLFAESFDHLPPLLIQSGGCEALRDEAHLLAGRIRESSVVTHQVYPDMPHVFQALPVQQAQLALRDVRTWMNHVLGPRHLIPG